MNYSRFGINTAVCGLLTLCTLHITSAPLEAQWTKPNSKERCEEIRDQVVYNWHAWDQNASYAVLFEDNDCGRYYDGAAEFASLCGEVNPASETFRRSCQYLVDGTLISSIEARQRLQLLERRGGSEGWTFDVGISLAFRIPLEKLAATTPPNQAAFGHTNSPLARDVLSRSNLDLNNLQQISFSLSQNSALPSRFDARTYSGVIPAIRMQGACGSCWAFAAVSSLEIFNNLYSWNRTLGGDNFSEQQLISCNTSSFGCQGGFIIDENDNLNLGNAGIVNEGDFPYSGAEIPCTFSLSNFNPSEGYMRTFPKAEPLTPPDPKQISSESEIKKAVYSYGSVWTTIYADDAFQGYKSGIFNACRSDLDVGEINHAVNIVGWNDAGGYWIVRNSWNTSWGENGYANVKYRCNNLGAWSHKYSLEARRFTQLRDGSLRFYPIDGPFPGVPWLR